MSVVRSSGTGTEARGGMRTFAIVWFGQLVSVVGSGLTSFALGIWVLLETGSVTAFALITLAITLPGLLISPVAGAYVDRWDRRVTMLAADLVAGLATAAVAVVFLAGTLQLWHIYLNATVISLARAFQEPAYLSAVPTLVPKERLSRANGLVQMGEALGTLLSPAIAGVLLVTIGLGGVMLIDFATFLLAVTTLAVVRFPSVRDPVDNGASDSIWLEAREGWRYLRSRRGMLALLAIFAIANFLLSIMLVIYPPMLLAFTTEQVLGFVVSTAGLGMLAGSVLMSTWEGPRSKILGLLVPFAIGGVAIAIGGMAPSAVLVAGTGFVFLFTLPIANTSSQVIWQTKVPLELQGRAFSVRRVFAQSATPFAYVVAGPLADRLFEPWLADGGAFAGSVGSVIGTGPGRGMGFMLIVIGGGMLLLALGGWLYSPVRNLERNHPDVIPETGVAPVV